MASPQSRTSPVSAFGSLLQYWRKQRGLSQLALAHEADVSPRHVCFVETGRAKPSREMVLLLARVLDVPLREQNALLLSAGFAPVYREAGISAPEFEPVRGALDAILRQQEPYPAVIMNRWWDILRTNDAGTRFFAWLLGERSGTATPNVLRLIFDPKGLRPHLSNWDAVAESLVLRLRREAVGGVLDPATATLLEEILAYPGVPRRFRTPDWQTPLVPIIPVSFRKAGKVFDYFSTVTTLGTPQDITLQELRIECFFPVNRETEERARELLG